MAPPLRTLLAPVAVLALVITACGGDDGGRAAATSTTTATTEVDTGTNEFTPDPISWASCGPKLECAEVVVPLDYADPSGDTFRVAVARVPATGERIGALFVNPGGPGASGATFAEQLALLLPKAIRERFDIVGVDPRGVGGSTPIKCGMSEEALYAPDPTIDSPADRTELLAVSAAYTAECATSLGKLLPHLGTRDVARDMDSVRAAMGDETLSYLGASYGTSIGQQYAELFPTHVRSMVLDAVVDLGPTGLEQARDQAKGFEQALARYVADCRSDPTCATSADPLGAIDRMLAKAEQPGGVPAPNASRPLGPSEANLGLGQALYSPLLWGQLDQAVHDAVGGDGSGMVTLADEYLGISGFDVYFAVNCLDYAWPTGDPGAVLDAGTAANAVAPHFGEAIVNDYVRCATWPVPPEPLTPVSAPGTPPIVVISTTGDPATPYEAGVNVAHRLESGVLVTHDGDGHGSIASFNGCIDGILRDYFVDQTVPAEGTVCKD